MRTTHRDCAGFPPGSGVRWSDTGRISLTRSVPAAPICRSWGLGRDSRLLGVGGFEPGIRLIGRLKMRVYKMIAWLFLYFPFCLPSSIFPYFFLMGGQWYLSSYQVPVSRMASYRLAMDWSVEPVQHRQQSVYRGGLVSTGSSAGAQTLSFFPVMGSLSIRRRVDT
jgi:hypothetical protein